MKKDCFHCGELVITGDNFSVEINGAIQLMCCVGCEAIAQTIVSNGLTSYYLHRTDKADKTQLIPDELASLQLYDNDAIQQEFVHTKADQKKVLLSIEGVSCAACAWLIEKRLSALPGIINIKVNTTTNRAFVVWSDATTQLSKIIHTIQSIGYNAAPFEADKQEKYYHQTMKKYLYRLGIAGIATMQVMMLALAMYFEVFGDMDEDFRHYFRWISLLFATPVLLYSAFPFYKNAWRNVKTCTLGMDVPVSIALLFAYVASFYATATNEGEVFFESIAMFTFFLLIGRFLEMRARRTATAASANLLKLIPKLATLTNGNQVIAASLKPTDCIRILPGETFPADGVIVKGSTSIDQSMMTGEFLPETKTLHDKVYAGTVNIEGNVEVEVTAEKKDAFISRIITLQDQAQSQKPKVAEIADTVARYFIASILVISFFTWWYWQNVNPEDAFWIMLSVLVATCPCALSLATPTALTCATSTFGKMGLHLRKGHVFQTLTKVNHVILDKTGTLTEGDISIKERKLHNNANLNVLQIACELESHANHPIATAFKQLKLATPTPSSLQLEQIENIIGEGIKGFFKGDEWRIGHPTFTLNEAVNHQYSHHQVWLSKNGQAQMSFFLVDPLRSEAKNVVTKFKNAGLRVTILTGDNSITARQVSDELKVDSLIASVTPQQKLAFLNQLPTSDITMMIGDGVNDAPVLSGAHLSVAMGGGTDIAKTSADMILIGDNLSKLLIARKLGIFTHKIIKQNLAWALSYNLLILPLAVLGYVAPYVAVAGMSASSVIVVSNSLRLFKKDLIKTFKD